MTTQNIFDIGDELNRIAEAFDALEEAGTDEELLASIEAYFGSLLDKRDEKLDRYASLIAWQESLALSADDEIKRLTALRDARRNFAKRLKDRLKSYFECEGITKIETPRHKFSVCQNGGAVPVLIDEGINPENWKDTDYVQVKYEWNKDEIRDALANGIPCSIGKLGERGTHLRIR